METRKSFPDKKEIRKKHLAIRNAMSEPETAEKNRAICEKLLTSDWYAITDWIFGYYPLGKEADCLEFLKKALVIEPSHMMSHIYEENLEKI